MPAGGGPAGVQYVDTDRHAGEVEIARRRFYREAGPVQRTRVNHLIRITPIRLIGADGEQVGVVETSEAMRLADEAGLDLVEVVPDSRPPVCRIMDYGKFKYEQSKKQKKSSASKTELKEIRLGRSTKIDPHDVGIRIEQARRFLMEGHKVLVVQRFRGREMQHRELGIEHLTEVAKAVENIAKIESPPRLMGRAANLVLAPDKPKIEAVKAKLAREKAAAEKEQTAEAPPADAKPAKVEAERDKEPAGVAKES
jgi:translation initiation factor IF-3